MKKIYVLLITLLLVLPINSKAKEVIDVYLFHSATCTHCQAEIEYLKSVKDEYNLDLHMYEVTERTTEAKNNASVMQNVREKLGIKENKTPLTIIGTTYYIGFEDSIKASMDEFFKTGEIGVNVVKKILNNENIKGITINNGMGSIDKLHLFGKEINLNNLSIPVIAVIIGFIDGFNPCAMWVLIFLITMLMNMQNKKRMWTLGITFLVASALVYLMFMLAWLTLIGNLSSIVWFRLLIAIIALIGGFVNLRSFYNSIRKNAGCEVVDDKKRKSIIGKIKKIVGEKSFILALIGVVALAFSVNIIELACSAGLPMIFTQILALNNLGPIGYMVNILIYIFFFLIDDIIVFSIAMITLNITGISTKYTKYSHLIGGIIMVLIGILMAFKPEWLMFNL